jgi:T5orf172 domain
MKDPGYVYLLINLTLEGLVKIGKTNRDPSARVKELSASTGVPTPFVLAFDSFFEDCTAAEEYVHTLLKQRGYRIAENKEFFRVPMNEAIKIIVDAQKHFDSQKKVEDIQRTPLVASSDRAIQALLSEAQENLDSTGEVLRNPKKALQLYKQASKLGSGEAFLKMGLIYQRRLVKIGGQNVQRSKVRECFEEAGNRGAGLCLPKQRLTRAILKKLGANTAAVIAEAVSLRNVIIVLAILLEPRNVVYSFKLTLSREL